VLKVPVPFGSSASRDIKIECKAGAIAIETTADVGLLKGATAACAPLVGVTRTTLVKFNPKRVLVLVSNPRDCSGDVSVG
jgi:hypothetical protein